MLEIKNIYIQISTSTNLLTHFGKYLLPAQMYFFSGSNLK